MIDIFMGMGMCFIMVEPLRPDLIATFKRMVLWSTTENSSSVVIGA
jgi:hypothetical protein